MANQTIQKGATAAYFTVTDLSGVVRPYGTNDYDLVPMGDNIHLTVIHKYSTADNKTIINNQPYTSIINGDTSSAFSDYNSCITYILTNFFRNAGGSGGSYTLPVATTSTLGGVKQGNGVTIAGDGTLSTSGINVYNVKSSTYGAKGDGTTDDTVAIQAAINAADAAGGGIVYFPNGVYVIGGAINATYNSQLYIPYRAFNTANRFQITLLGESITTIPSGGGLSLGVGVPPPTSGVVLKSTLSIFTTAGQAVIGTKIGSINVTYLEVKNIDIIVLNNPASSGPVVGGISWKAGCDCRFINVSCSIDTYGYASTLPSNDVTGIELPDNGASNIYYLNNCTVVGFRTGYKFGEHVTFDQITAQCCFYGLQTKPGYHSSTSTRSCISWCAHTLFAGTTLPSPPLANFSIDIEWQFTGTKWYDSLDIISDSTNVLQGEVYYTIIESFVGFNNNRFSMIGGGKLSTIPHISPYISNGSGFTKGSSITSAYKISGANDLLIYNITTAGNISILNDYGSGSIIMAAGGSSTYHHKIDQNGRSSFSAPNDSIPAYFIGKSSGNTQLVVDAASGKSSSTVYYTNGIPKWYTGENATSGVDTYQILNSDSNGNIQRFNLTQAGLLQLSGYGAGVATFDSSGNITSKSPNLTTTNTSGTDAAYTINLTNGDNIILPAITAGRIVTFPTIVDGKIFYVWNKNSSANTWSIAGTPVVTSPTGAAQTTVVNQTYSAFIGSSTASAWIRLF